MLSFDDSDLLSPADWSPSAWRQWAESLAAHAKLNVDAKSIRRGHAVIVTTSSAWPKNPNGALHGGIVAAAITHCATVAGTVSFAPHSTVRPTALAVAFLRPAVPPLTLEAHVHETGSPAIFATVAVRAEDGRMCATAQVTQLPDDGALDNWAGARAWGAPITHNPPGLTANIVPAPAEGDAQAWRSWAERLPVSQAIGLRCLAISSAHATVVMEKNGSDPSAERPVPHGVVAAWADHCFGLVATAAVPPGVSPATATLSSQFLAPAVAPLTFHATVEKSGRTLAFVNVDVRDSTDQLVSDRKSVV